VRVADVRAALVERLSIEPAGKRALVAVDYEAGDAGRLRYADGSFDVGYCADTLEIAPLDRRAGRRPGGSSGRATSSSTTP